MYFNQQSTNNVYTTELNLTCHTFLLRMGVMCETTSTNTYIT